MTLRVVMDLSTVGEFAADVCRAFAAHKGTTVEDEDYAVIARAAWESLKFMQERAVFAREATAELAALPTTETPLFDTSQYERRMEGPS